MKTGYFLLKKAAGTIWFSFRAYRHAMFMCHLYSFKTLVVTLLYQCYELHQLLAGFVLV